jgi:uncharacterized protein YndB with AHSA1/START domain
MSKETELTIVRVFEAGADAVFQQWTQPELVAAWFAPDAFAVTSCSLDVRVGGRWRVEYRTGSEKVVEEGEYLDISPPHQLAFTLQQTHGGMSGALTTVRIALRELGGKTEMTFLQSGFESGGLREQNAAGWASCFGKLEGNLLERASTNGAHSVSA